MGAPLVSGCRESDETLVVFSLAAPSLRSWQAEVIVHGDGGRWWRFSVSGQVQSVVSVTTVGYGRNVEPSASMGDA